MLLEKTDYSYYSRNVRKSAFLILFFLIFLFCSNIAKATYSMDVKTPSASNNWCLDYYLKEWVEQPADSTLFNPTIQIYREEFIACVVFKDNIKLKPGECKDMFLGLYRYCARFTEPDEHGNDYACDPTTTSTQDPITGEVTETTTLNCDSDSSGLSTGDDCYKCRCQCAQRICGYYDIPGSSTSDDYQEPEYGVYKDSSSDDDGRYCCLDPPLTYYYQPYHKNTPNPCCDMEPACRSLWGYPTCGGSDKESYADGSVINANATWVGCVDIPLGPYPPPLCDPIQGSTPGVSSSNICVRSPDYEGDSLSSDDNDVNDYNNYNQTSIACDDGSTTCSSICEYSTANGEPTDSIIYSTFEKPLVRLYFENPLDLCPGDTVTPEPAPVNDYCVQFLESNLTGEQIWKNERNLLPVCAQDTTTPDCISFLSKRSTGPSGSSSVLGTEYKYFKPYYYVSDGSPNDTGARPFADYTYNNKYPDAKANLGGIHDTYYADMTDSFTNDNYTVKIVDYMSVEREFQSYLDVNDENGDGTQLCIYENVEDSLEMYRCFDRPKMFAPKVYPCLEVGSCGYSSGATPYEQPRISFSVGIEQPKSGIIGIDLPTDAAPATFCIEGDDLSGGTPASNPAPCTVYKAKLFSAYLTDDVNYQISIDTDTDGSGTEDAIGTVTPYSGTEAYSGGMQFVNSVYCRGATKICLTGYDTSTKSVVAKKVNGMVSNLLTDRVIPPYVEDESLLTDEQLYNPAINDSYATSSQSNIEVVIGYENEDPNAEPGSYVSQPSCTSGEDASAAYIKCTVNSGVTTYPSEEITCTCSNNNGAYDCTGDNDQCMVAFEQTTISETSTLVGYKPSESSNILYPKEDYGVRVLNSMELGQCVEAAQPYCGSIDETISSSTAYTNGYASWEQTNAGDTAIGTCVDGMVRDEDENGNPLDPTRDCLFVDTLNVDGTPVLEENGCPTYSVSWGEAITNPCVSLPYPTWWPSQFITGENFQGAIFNQFNIIYDYEDIFFPNAGNYNPFNTKDAPNYSDPGVISSSSSTWVEDWYTTSTYDSCKDYRGNRNTSNTPRNQKDGDQEMLFLTRAHWQRLWDTNDLTWLLEEKEENNGCYVYELGANINATFTGMAIGMKICKYEHKISFSLVDTQINTAKDCTNNAYIMQSNLIAYDQYIGKYAVGTGRDGSFVPKTTVSNSLIGRRSNYHHYINHGIVVNKLGFEENEYVQEITKNPPPITFSEPCMTQPEGITASFLFAGQFQYDTGGGNYQHYTFNPNSPNASCTGDGSRDYNDLTKPKQQVKTCAISAYRSNLDYSTTVNSGTALAIDKYLPKPDNINPKNYSSDSDMSNNTSYITKMYQYSCYNGDHKDDTWPQQTECAMDITLKDYVSGNSALNPHMFLWDSPTSYKPCN